MSSITWAHCGLWCSEWRLVYGYFAVIAYGNPTSFPELCKGEAVGLFTGGSTDPQPFLMLGIVFLFLWLLLPHLPLPLSSTLLSNALAPVCLHSKSLWENDSSKGGSLQAVSALALQPTRRQRLQKVWPSSQKAGVECKEEK